MLRPYIFIVCEKVLVDKNDVASLIGLFNKFTITVSGEVPSNAVAPKEWSIFTSWHVEPSDLEKNYVQVFRISYPNGEQFGELGRIVLQVSPGKSHAQTVANSQGLPIGQNGPYTVESWLQENDKKIGESISMEFEVEVQKVEAGKEIKA